MLWCGVAHATARWQRTLRHEAVVPVAHGRIEPAWDSATLRSTFATSERSRSWTSLSSRNDETHLQYEVAVVTSCYCFLRTNFCGSREALRHAVTACTRRLRVPIWWCCFQPRDEDDGKGRDQQNLGLARGSIEPNWRAWRRCCCSISHRAIPTRNGSSTSSTRRCERLGSKSVGVSQA
jgi:hypothetical protein